jgi:hypothetical protein
MTIKIKILNYTIKISKNRDKYNKKVKRNGLEAPAAPPGYIHRWIRAETMVFSKKSRGGWSLVKPPKTQKNLYPTVDEGRFKGYIGVGGLLLAKINMKRLGIR